jgi:large subunit ribosomal protein L10
METVTTKRPPKPKKIETMHSLAERMSRARGLYLTEYKGLTVEEISDLRRQFYLAKVDYVVCKNTFARRAAQKQGLEGLIPQLSGPTAIAFSYHDAAAPAKILFDFAAKNEKLVLKGGLFEGKAISPKEIEAIKNLPSRDQALAMIVGVVFAPVQEFHNVLTAVLRDFVSVIDQIAEQKKAA